MDSASYLAFALAIAAALASPGPAFIVMLRAGLSAGRRAALLTGIGLACMAVTWTALALLGLGALFAAAPILWIAFKIAGAGYLLWLALTIWRAADQPVAAVPTRRGGAFVSGVLTNLSNPKAVIFIAAIFATLLPAALSPADALKVLALHFALEATFYAGLAILLTSAPIRGSYLAAKRGIDRTAAALLALLAGRLALGAAR